MVVVGGSVGGSADAALPPAARPPIPPPPAPSQRIKLACKVSGLCGVHHGGESWQRRVRAADSTPSLFSFLLLRRSPTSTPPPCTRSSLPTRPAPAWRPRCRRRGRRRPLARSPSARRRRRRARPPQKPAPPPARPPRSRPWPTSTGAPPPNGRAPRGAPPGACTARSLATSAGCAPSRSTRRTSGLPRGRRIGPSRSGTWRRGSCA